MHWPFCTQSTEPSLTQLPDASRRCSVTYFCACAPARRKPGTRSKVDPLLLRDGAFYTSGSEPGGGSGPQLRFQRLAASFLPRAG